MNIEPMAFTVDYHQKVREIATLIGIGQEFNPVKNEPPSNYKNYTGIWDTGATCSAITQKVVDENDLHFLTYTKVFTASEEKMCPVYLASIWLPNKLIFSAVKVTVLPINRFDILIGMDIIGWGDFAFTNKNNTSLFSFCFPSQEHIDFTGKQKHIQNKPINAIPKVGRNLPVLAVQVKNIKIAMAKFYKMIFM